MCVFCAFSEMRNLFACICVRVQRERGSLNTLQGVGSYMVSALKYVNHFALRLHKEGKRKRAESHECKTKASSALSLCDGLVSSDSWQLDREDILATIKL